MRFNKCKTTGELEQELERAIRCCSRLMSGCERMDEIFNLCADKGKAYNNVLMHSQLGYSLEELKEYLKDRKDAERRLLSGFSEMNESFETRKARKDAYHEVLECLRE